ncbi:MAG TPA: hypothetical protein VEX18_12755 [Polyangiaceae bacterium]|nr:hypothetical protein [Polyangiaceae bacterium]
MDRFVRQRTLAAVGDRGQQRLADASFAIEHEHTVPAATERHYLERAGAQNFSATEGPRAPFAHAQAFRHQVARDFAEGAWRALDQIQRVLAAP